MAVGQVPEYIQKIVEWVKEVAKTPVIVKLTPNISDIIYPAIVAKKAGADALSLINTINSVMSVDLNNFTPNPNVGGSSAHGGYCGPAVKPIALNMVSSIANHQETYNIPISGIGGISTWQDAVEFMLLGASNVQVCTAVIHHGFRIVEDMIDGLQNWMIEKNFNKIEDFVGLSKVKLKNWGNLDLNFKSIANINQDKCIKCGLCYIACEDASHQSIKYTKTASMKKFEIIEEACVGCNLCEIVCPVESCITMVSVDQGKAFMSWNDLQKQKAGK